MNIKQKSKTESHDLMRKFGSRWAILAAMRIDMNKKGIELSKELNEKFENAKIKIRSGCYSVCDVECVLSGIEASILPQALILGDDYVDGWMKLLERVSNDEINLNELTEIPALEPVRQDCESFRCSCAYE